MTDRKSWIESSDVFALFSTVVWKIQVAADLRASVGTGMLAVLRPPQQELPELKAGKAWQSGVAMHRREKLRELCDCVRRAATSVLQFLRVGDQALEITGCWATDMRRVQRIARTAIPTTI